MIDTDVLIRRRTLAGLSQRKLAKLAGVNAMTIKRLEDGADASELPLGVLARIAAAVDLQARDLLTDERCAQAEVAAASTCDAELDDRPLDHNAARLLRRIHRGEDIRRTMTRAEREMTLPKLVRRGLVTVAPDGVAVSPAAQKSLANCWNSVVSEGLDAEEVVV